MTNDVGECVAELRAAVERVVKELGAWAALYWATEFVRGPLKAQAKADARPKQPRREADQ